MKLDPPFMVGWGPTHISVWYFKMNSRGTVNWIPHHGGGSNFIYWILVNVIYRLIDSMSWWESWRNETFEWGFIHWHFKGGWNRDEETADVHSKTCNLKLVFSFNKKNWCVLKEVVEIERVFFFLSWKRSWKIYIVLKEFMPSKGKTKSLFYKGFTNRYSLNGYRSGKKMRRESQLWFSLEKIWRRRLWKKV